MPLFPPQFHSRFKLILALLCAAVVLVLGGIYYHTFRQNIYSPVQPIEFSHQIHVEKLGMDCVACHTGALSSSQAGIPDTASCLDCHKHVKRDSPKIEPLLKAADKDYPGYTGHPVKWVKVNRIAGHARFNHQAHTSRGIGCAECHGDSGTSIQVSAEQNRGMRWCMDCHKNPTDKLRPLGFITSPTYDAKEYLKNNHVTDAKGLRVSSPQELQAHLSEQYRISPKTDCTSCHQ